MHVAAIQEVRWPGHGEREFTAVDPIANTSFKYHIYYSGGEKAMHGVGFVVIGDQKNRVIKWKVENKGQILQLQPDQHLRSDERQAR